MKILLLAAMAAVVAGTVAGCVAPSPEISRFTLQQAEFNRAYSERIEAVGRSQQREERMTQAEAAEVASRHNPSNVSTTTVYAPRF